jgi:hypothetical protein
MTNKEVRALLRECSERPTSTFPFPEGSDVDHRLAMTIGIAVASIYEGLAEEVEGRPLRIGIGGRA